MLPACDLVFRQACRWLARPLVLLFVLLVTTIASAQEPARLRVGLDADYPPFEWVDASGRPQGYTVELFQALAKSQKLDVEFRSMRWCDLVAAFERGEIDVLTGMASSERRMKTIDFSIPHSTLLYSILTRKDEVGIRSERDLAGKLILVEEGDVLSEYLLAQGLKVQGVGSPREAIQKLSGGFADCAIIPRLTWLHFERSSGIRNLRVVPSERFHTKYCFAVRKGHEALLAKLNEGLFLAKENGTMDSLHDRFLGSLEATDLSLKVAFRRALPSMLTAMLLLGLLTVFVWSLSLRRIVRLKTVALQSTILELEGTLAQVKQLSGLIPMCAGCKKIRDDAGYWEAVEDYIGKHSEARFSHGLCPGCMEVYFPGFRKSSQLVADPEKASE